MSNVSNLAMGALQSTLKVGSLVTSLPMVGNFIRSHLPAARIGDLTTGVCDHNLPCCPHITTGWVVTGSLKTLINMLGATRLFDITATTCPHCGIGMAITGSVKNLVDFLPKVRLLDKIIQPGGIATVTNGSADTQFGP